MLLRAAFELHHGDPSLSLALEALAEALELSSPDDLAVGLCLHPGLALDLAFVPLHLRVLGRGDGRLEPLLSELFGRDRLRGPERPPHRELEQMWLHSLWSGHPEPASLARALSSSCLAWKFDHLASTTEDAYAFTHAILYATDHGRRLPKLPRPVDEIVCDANVILAVALDAGNHDVAAEVLWTWPMLGSPWTPLAMEARFFLADVSKTWGFLPGPGFDPSIHEGLTASQREEYVLRTSYHTTLVHGLLLAAILTSEGHLQSKPGAGLHESVVPSAWRDSAEVVTALLQPNRLSAAWWSHFAALPISSRDLLAPALVSMALRRSATAANLSAIREALSTAGEFQFPESPVTQQAHLLLRRAMTCSEFAGATVDVVGGQG